MMMIGWGLSEALCYLRHLELHGEATRLGEADTERWALAAARPFGAPASTGARRAARPGSRASTASG